MLLPLQGALLTLSFPRVLPWAMSFCPFGAYRTIPTVQLDIFFIDFSMLHSSTFPCFIHRLSHASFIDFSMLHSSTFPCFIHRFLMLHSSSSLCFIHRLPHASFANFCYLFDVFFLFLLYFKYKCVTLHTIFIM